jgi:cold shock CspA family protein
MQTGTIKLYKQLEGYAFIEPDGPPEQPDVFVKRSTLRMAMIKKLEPGQRVKFETRPSASTGKPVAFYLRLIKNEEAA